MDLSDGQHTAASEAAFGVKRRTESYAIFPSILQRGCIQQKYLVGVTTLQRDFFITGRGNKVLSGRESQSLIFREIVIAPGDVFPYL